MIEQLSASRHEPCAFRAPDLIEALVAFRCWRVVDGRLRSPYLPVFWDERVLDARCRDRGEQAAHAAPEPSCRCGIYAYLEPDLDFPKIDYRAVTGIVTLWGQIEVHAEGMRAEHARIEALALYSRSSNRHKSAVWAIADALGVDLVDLSDTDDAADRYGSRLPAALLPQQQPVFSLAGKTGSSEGSLSRKTEKFRFLLSRKNRELRGFA